MSNLPGGAISKRPLHFVWVIDTSGSMVDKGKMQILNNAVREAVPHMQKVAEDNPHADVLVRVLRFSDGAQWINNTPIPISKFNWYDLYPEGETQMGKAFSMLADQLSTSRMPDRGLPPVLVLVSDGMPTDDVNAGLKELFEQPWGKRAVRIAIAIGDENNVDLDILQKFIGNYEIKPLKAGNAESLVNYIKWSSTAVLKYASSPPSQLRDRDTQKSVTVKIPEPPPPILPDSGGPLEPW
jgi:uncharacterized protein YegL